MAETDANLRERIMDDLADSGELPTLEEVEALVHDAERVDWAEELLESVGSALAHDGMALVDVTTDDDDRTVYRVVREE